MDLPPIDLARRIQQHALQSGFALAGITTAEPLPHAEVFERWLEAGRQGEMAYLASERSRALRAHPQRVLPGCGAVLVLGVRYPAPTEAEAGEDLDGRVAAYAWGEDYHLFLLGRLKEMMRFIEQQVGHPVGNRWYTDSGPILERELAQRAGLGWIGKNTCLINPQHGSYFLLAEILLDIELKPDPPFTADRCGSCRRCLQACPTGCILPDRTLDARRCLSYLTIELKGSIPAELRPLMGERVFGCDVCQLVCPWNRFASEAVDPAYSQVRLNPHPNLVQELTLQPADFNQKYRHSALSRPKRRGYLRNVAVALGNTHSPAAVPALARALSADAEALVRGHAAWALGQVGSAAARLALETAFAAETDPAVRAEIQSALANPSA